MNANFDVIHESVIGFSFQRDWESDREAACNMGIGIVLDCFASECVGEFGDVSLEARAIQSLVRPTPAVRKVEDGFLGVLPGLREPDRLVLEPGAQYRLESSRVFGGKTWMYPVWVGEARSGPHTIVETFHWPVPLESPRTVEDTAIKPWAFSLDEAPWELEDTVPWLSECCNVDLVVTNELVSDDDGTRIATRGELRDYRPSCTAVEEGFLPVDAGLPEPERFCSRYGLPGEHEGRWEQQFGREYMVWVDDPDDLDEDGNPQSSDGIWVTEFFDAPIPSRDV